ncbi:MAG: DUF1800 domain-containing protein [Pseudoxanthomonas sp.]|nr:DUF1800 domain-containing protein [Pseudoxanthomonas sp.]
MITTRLLRQVLALALVATVLAACGGGGGGNASSPSPSITAPPPAPPPAPPFPDIPATDGDAARFLTQASFGPTPAEIARVRQIGYSRWIDEQLSASTTPPTLMLPHLEQLVANGIPRTAPALPYLIPQHRRNYWLWMAATGNDQLRMRMSFALSQIFVVSDRDTLDANQTLFRISDYQDTLSRGAFGSYRDLLDNVSRHPAMGYYLSHVNNRKADLTRNITPDENYGREIMQLFSIGLVERNLDFSLVPGQGGQPVPTYDESVVSAMARAFTGWTYATNATEAQFGRNDNLSYEPMRCYPRFHDDQPKQIFRGITVNNGSDCVANMTAVMDALAAHPNVAPFISRQLIQRFVTSNPSPAYVERVSRVWLSSNGNLGQVVRAVLLDTEARLPPTIAAYGKAREPLIKIATLWRAFGARYIPPANGQIIFRYASAGDLSTPLAQESMRAPSVFNFYDPNNRLAAADGAQGIYAPEFQILTEATYLTALNQHEALLWNYSGDPPTANTVAPILDISRLVTLATTNDHAGMVQVINTLLFYGTLSDAARQTMINMLDRLAAAQETPAVRARSLVLLALASPEFAVQR